MTGNDLVSVLGLLNTLLRTGRGIQTGSPVGALTGTIGAGQQIANLLDNPAVSSALGTVGNTVGGVLSPLGFASALKRGDPLGALASGASTASTVSGMLGGPTFSSLLSSLASSLGLTSGATAGAAAGAGAAGAGTGAATAGLAASAAPMAAAAPFVMMILGGLHAAMTGGGDMFDSMFGEDRTQAVKQRDEYLRARANFDKTLQDKIAGASLDGQHFDDPTSLLNALKTASRGIWANDQFGPALMQINNGERVAKIPGQDMSALINVAPQLDLKQYSSWLKLMDQANGLDTKDSLTRPFTYGVSDDHLTPMTINIPGERYRTANISLKGDSVPHYMGGESAQDPTTWNAPNNVWENDYTGGSKDASGRDVSTQEALDLNHAIAALGGAQGLDPLLLPGGGWDDRQQAYKPGARTDVYQGFGGYLAPEQLAQYGITPGHYEQGVSDFLKMIQDPSKQGQPAQTPSLFQNPMMNDSAGGGGE